MTRILVQRGSSSSSSSSNQSRSSTSVSVPNPSSSSAPPQQQAASIAQVSPAVKDENLVDAVQEHNAVDELAEYHGILDSKSKGKKSANISPGSLNSDQDDGDKKNIDNEKVCYGHDDIVGNENATEGFDILTVVEEEDDATIQSSYQTVAGSSQPPPPPVPPPKISSLNSKHYRRSAPTDSNAVRIGPSRRTAGKERQFEIDLRRVKGLEVRKMLEDGNCLFRAVADQVYDDSELYDLVRQMCIDYMERERDHFSQFLTEGFTSYCKRQRRDKRKECVLTSQRTRWKRKRMWFPILYLKMHISEMYNRPIHIYSYSTEPINIFHGSYNTDTPPIRLSYHHGNHYNSLVDPRRLTIGAGLGFSSLQGTNIDKDQVKAANALLAEGRFYSDLELTEKEIERMVMEASRAEYIADDKFKQQFGRRESSTSSAEPSSSAARSSRSDTKKEGGREFGLPSSALSGSMQIMLSMGFTY